MSIKKEYSADELSSLMADVEKEFSTALAKAEKDFALAKSEDESKEKDEKKASDESHGESKKPMESEKPEDKGAKDQHQEAPKGDEQAAAQSAEAPKEGEKAAPAEANGEESHGYDDEDMQHMHSMYSSMSKPELKAHHDCIRKCMDGMGLAKCEDSIAKAEMEDGKEGEHRPNGGPHDGEAASKKTPASSDAQALEKSEKGGLVVDEVALIKSELEAVKASDEAKKKELEAVTAFLKKFVEKTAPAGKAITSLDIIAKTEDAQKEKPLSKSEIDAKLLAKAKDVSLSKSDREAINSYYFTKNIEKVSHLLK
jgi:hypothetical protein